MTYFEGRAYGEPTDPQPVQPPAQQAAATGTWQEPPRPGRDETTRLLSAAAHLDRSFADDAVREFLVEPLRAVAPSPGVDAAAVLREALAARTRRRIRDLVLAALTGAFFAASTGLFLTWLITAAAWSFLGPSRRRFDGRHRKAENLRSVMIAVVVVFVLWVVVGIVRTIYALTKDGDALGGARSSDPFGSGGQDTSDVLAALAGGVSWVALVLGLLIVAVVLVDRLAVWSLITVTFRRGRYTAEPGAVDRHPGERLLRTMGSARQKATLLQLSASPAGNVVVYRGNEPFVGAGLRYGEWSLAIPLDPAPGSEPGLPAGARFRPSELYDHIGAELRSMTLPSSLSPSHRLGGLKEIEKVFVSADVLVAHLGEQESGLVLPDPRRAPVQRIRPDTIRDMADRPVEWMRYYRCFEVESWDRNLAVSLHVNVGTDDRMLYLACTPCLLPPIREEYHRVDEARPGSYGPPILDALGSAVMLPLTLPGRLVHALRRLRPVSDEPTLVTPARYGARDSLRELAMTRGEFEYFQVSDAKRYAQVLEARLIRAVGSFLDARGISVTEFMAQAAAVQNTFFDVNSGGGDIVGSAFGTGNQVSGTATSLRQRAGAQR
jgi:hypothetical protein